MDNCLLEGFATVPVLTEPGLTVTGPKLVPKTPEGSLLFRTVTRFAALVALLSRKAYVSVTTTEPPVTLSMMILTGLPVSVGSQGGHKLQLPFVGPSDKALVQPIVTY